MVSKQGGSRLPPEIEVVPPDVPLDRCGNVIANRFILSNATPDVAGGDLNERNVDDLELPLHLWNPVNDVFHVDNNTGSKGDSELHKLRQTARFMPVGKVTKRILTHKEDDLAVRESLLVFNHTVGRVGQP